jgi:hypothetical protein
MRWLDLLDMELGPERWRLRVDEDDPDAASVELSNMLLISCCMPRRFNSEGVG